MDSGISRVISALVFTIGIGSAFAYSMSSEKNYATVSHENGYTKIGVIYEERARAKAKISNGEEVIYEDDLAGAAPFILGIMGEEQTADTAMVSKGAFVTVTREVKWVASRQNFTLTIAEDTITSDGTMSFGEMAKRLTAMDLESQTDRENYAHPALSFEKNPDTGVISTLASMMKR